MSEGTILLVDDDDALRSVLSRLLARNGHSILEAHDADEAVRLIVDGGVSLSLVILDVVLPPPGPAAVLETLTNHMRPMRVLLISGLSADQLQNTAVYRLLEGSEVFRFLEKPFTAEELTATVTELLHQAHDVIEMITGEFRGPDEPRSAS